MQNEPEKTAGNYNELRSAYPLIPLPEGVIKLQTEERYTEDLRGIVLAGLELVNGRVNEILGSHNRLTNRQLTFPKIKLIQTDPEHPNWAGYFLSHKNEITLIADSIKDHPLDRMKVFIHEYVHFLCHNGRDDGEEVGSNSPIAQNNNVGFRRQFGLDIREGMEDEITTDYFLSFNEAVTEQLAIDILPGIHETYSDYRGLLNQAIDDAVTLELGSKNEDGVFIPWSREQVKNYIYVCFFRGDLAGFTGLLQTTYKKYNISEQQFGLMTTKDDLPSIIEAGWFTEFPGGRPPTPSQIAITVQRRLNTKISTDYITDIVDPKPGTGDSEGENDYGIEYDAFVEANIATTHQKVIIEGVECDIDSSGLIIYRGDAAAARLNYVKGQLDDLLAQLQRSETSTADINQQIDELLFDTYRISMLSDGFRDFYIYKHTKIDTL
jgi:hypothetical protein